MKKISIVEDDAGIQDALKMVLGNKFDLHIYHNTDDLLADTAAIPDIYMLDHMLSGTSGASLCKHLKSQPATRNIPVVIYSSHPEVKHIALEAGADEFMEKPFNLLTLRAVLSRLMSLQD